MSLRAINRSGQPLQVLRRLPQTVQGGCGRMTATFVIIGIVVFWVVVVALLVLAAETDF